MKLSPRVKAFLLIAMLGVLLYGSMLGARIIEYSGGSFSGLGFALSNAVQKEDTAVVRLLLTTGVDPNLLDHSTGMRPLSWAAAIGNLKIARILLRARADPDGSPNHPYRPLLYAAAGRDREMADLLLGHGASYKLMDAVFLGDTEFVEQALIENSKVLRDMRFNRRSLLSVAMGFDRLDTARYLLELGLDPTKEESGGGGYSVLGRARKGGRQDFVELFESYQSVSKPESEIVENP